MKLILNKTALSDTLSSRKGIVAKGFIESITGSTIKAKIIGPTIGEIFEIQNHEDPSKRLHAKAIGFESSNTILCPLGRVENLIPGCTINTLAANQLIMGNFDLLGTVLNSRSQILDRVSPYLKFKDKINKKIINPNNKAPDPLKRLKISEPFFTGIKAIDGFCTMGKGQRMAIFAEPGVGKTTLLSNIVKHNNSDINVIALIGERGREVQEFVYENLSDTCRGKTVIVSSTSDEPAVSRIQASLLATGIAEFFRDSGLNVLLVIDSLTRLFRAYREIGLASGEIPVRRGYPPSAYEQMPQLIERAGRTKDGSITALYSVLLSGELDEDPMVEEIKGLTDGHIVLRKHLAENVQYPAISISESLSRLQNNLIDKDHQDLINKIRKFKVEFDKSKDLLMLADNQQNKLEKLISIDHQLKKLICQDSDQKIDFENTIEAITNLASLIGE